MLTRFLIDIFFTGCIIGMPLAVWCVWKFGPVEVMRYLGLHSEEDNDFWDDEIECCDSCGESVSNEEMHHAYPFNGFESWGEALYSECTHCHQVELDRQNAEWSNRKIGK
tara:strand:+ start:1762 stop:2091 length:330 start_codon:yes stop_codon:yes gene_type:complete